MYFIYFLYSKKSDIYYVGHSNDYLKRFEQHNNTDRDTFTRKHRPLSGRSLLTHIKKASNKGYRIYIAFILLTSAELSMTRKAIEIEIRNRPKGNYVVIEEDNQIRFVPTHIA